MIKRIAAFTLACGLLTLPLGSALGAFRAANGEIYYVHTGSITSTVAEAGLPRAGRNPSVSPDGTKIAFDDGANLWTMNADGTSPVIVPGPVAGTNPSWNNDGTKLAYENGSNIFTVVVATGATSAALTSGGTNHDPAFSPDGTKIAYISGGTSLNTVPATGGGFTQILGGLASAGSPSWSPDGSQIAFSSAGQIWVTGSSPGGSLNQLADAGHTDTEPAWSPDGTLIAFATDTGISTMTTAGTNITHIAGAAGDTAPEWRDAPPANTAAPTITPTTPPFQGSTLFASTGSWTGSPTSFSYQWFRCNSSGSSCTMSVQGPSSTSSYTVQAADVGFPIVVQVTATNLAGASAPAQSPPAGTTVGPAPNNVTPPVISGSPNASSGFLVVSPGTWTGTAPITYTFQWQTCDWSNPPHCRDLVGATSSFYAPTGDDIGKRLQVIVTATNSQGTAKVTSGFSFVIVGKAPRAGASPTITGTIEVGSTLTGSNGTWTGALPIHFAYEWDICDPQGDNCSAIPGANTTTYLLQPGDYGSTIRFKVIGTNNGGADVGISIHTLPIRHRTLFGPASTAPPAIAGPARAGGILVSDPGTWTGEPPITFTYVWQRCDATGAGCVTIKGQTKSTYVPQAADIGSTVRVVVTGHNAVNNADATSDPTDAIGAARPHRKGRRIVGKPGQNVIVGTANDDVIYAGPGNVTIYGMGGYDQIHAGSGNDVIYLGTGGSSHVWGSSGSVTIRAANGERDTIDCGKGPSRVYADSFDIVRHCTVVTIVPASPTATQGLQSRRVSAARPAPTRRRSSG